MTGQTGEGKVLIKFASRTGDVLLTADGAAAHLMPDNGVAPQAAPRATRAVQQVRRTPCNTCSTDLREVVTSPDGTWRSCTQCSARHGRQHVFLPYPASFDVTEVGLAEGQTSDDPHHGWCLACRAGARATGYKTCNEVMR